MNPFLLFWLALAFGMLFWDALKRDSWFYMLSTMLVFMVFAMALVITITQEILQL